MERRLRAGEPWDAAAFLAAHPDIASDPDRAVDLLLREYFVRRQLGEALDPGEWFGRFPQWRELLQRRLQGLQTVSGAAVPLEAEAQTQEHAPKPAAAWDEAVPELGRHEVYEEVGRGAMGVVYRARDLVLNRPVALKMIAPRHGLLETPEAVRRFYREARAAARLRYPHIVPIHGMGLHQGRHCFTMPLLTGGSIAGRVAQREEPRAAVNLLEKIARAVQYAHEQGVIHRDLKPGNILLDEGGEPLVADFGLAKVLDGDADASTPGVRVGTPAYMSPEQAAGHTWKVSARSDVWALGVILYELLTGRRPFTGSETDGVFEQVMTAQPPAPRSVRPDLSADLESVVRKCLEKDPELRYQTAGALADDLARCLRNEALPRRPGAVPKSRPWRAARWLAPALGLVLLIVLAAAGPWLMPRPGEVPFPPAGLNTPSEEGDRQEALDALRREYAGEGKVRLVGDAGSPRWYQWPAGVVGMNPPYPPGRPLYLEGFGLVLMELLPPDPDRGGFRLEAQVFHDQSNNGRVGLYFAREGRRSGGREQCFASLVFADLGQWKGSVRLRRQRYRRISPDEAVLNLAATVFEEALPPLPGDGAGAKQVVAGPDFVKVLTMGPSSDDRWRKLVVEVRAKTLRVSWGGPAREVTIEAMTAATDPLLAKDVLPDPPPPPPFDGRGGLGLYVEDGKAFFRNVTVQPLQDP